MNHFDYKNGELHAEDVALSAIAAEVGTPFYCYSTATLERHYKVFASAFPKDTLIAFSVKANGNPGVGPDGQPLAPKGPKKQIPLDVLLN